jgi:hypothetical protein
MDVRSVGGGLLSRHRLVGLESQRVGWAGHDLVRGHCSLGVASLKGGNHPGTTLGRAIGSIWIASGTSMFLLFLALGLSGRLTDQHLFVAVISAILGMANGASGLILRWKVRFACALVWWVAAVITGFDSDAENKIVFLIAIFFCQIGFGVYGAIADGQESKPGGPIHA